MRLFIAILQLLFCNNASALTTGCISACNPTCDYSSGDMEISREITSIRMRMERRHLLRLRLLLRHLLSLRLPPVRQADWGLILQQLLRRSPSLLSMLWWPRPLTASLCDRVETIAWQIIYLAYRSLLCRPVCRTMALKQIHFSPIRQDHLLLFQIHLQLKQL